MPNRIRTRRIRNQVYGENPVLSSLGKRRDFKVYKARGKTRDYLKSINAGLEHYGKGDKSSDVTGSGYVPFKNKYRVAVDTEGKTESEVKDAAKLDFISHALHDKPEYNSLTVDLDTKLRDKYGDEMVDANGGVDGYIRGHLSDSKEYDAYKEELKFLGDDYFAPLDSMINNKPSKRDKSRKHAKAKSKK